MDNLRDVAGKLMDYTYRVEDGAELSSEELAEIVGLQIALDSYKDLLEVGDMDNK